MAFTRTDELERQARRLMGTDTYTKSHHPDHAKVQHVVAGLYRAAYPGPAKPPSSGPPPASRAISPAEAAARELMRSKAYSDTLHPDHKATQAAVAKTFERLYPGGR
jgi:hypothetical protein